MTLKSSVTPDMRVLISEDNPNQAELIERFLKPISSRIVVCHDLACAFQAIEDEEFDLITFDLNYPESVRSVTINRVKEIREKQPHVIIIIYTGHYEPEMEQFLIDSGADGIIKKTRENNTPDGFLAQVKSIVDTVCHVPKHEASVKTFEKAACRLAEYYQVAAPSI